MIRRYFIVILILLSVIGAYKFYKNYIEVSGDIWSEDETIITDTHTMIILNLP